MEFDESPKGDGGKELCPLQGSSTANVVALFRVVKFLDNFW